MIRRKNAFKVGVILFFVLFIIVLLCHANLCPVKAESSNVKSKKYGLIEEINNKFIPDSGVYKVEKTLGSSNVLSAGIDIEYPQSGKFYMANTMGKDNLLLDLLDKAFVIDGDLEVGVNVNGASPDSVKFMLYKGNNKIDSKTDSSPSNNNFFSSRFYNITSLFGVYKITIVAYQENSELCQDTTSDIILLKIGGGGNKKPLPIFETPRVVWQNKEVEFDGSQSYDPDGFIQRYHWNFGDGKTSDEINPKHTYTEAGRYTVSLTVTDGEGDSSTKKEEITVVDYNFGVWVITKYEGVKDEEKLDFGIQKFIDMLYHSSGSYTYDLTMEDANDTVIRFDFAKTKIKGIEAILTDLIVEVDESTDLSNDFEVGLEFRFPYSLLRGVNQPPSSEYFSARISYQYEGKDPGLQGPHDVHSWFYFGKKSLRDPGILRMKIDPYPYGREIVPLKYETSFLTVDEHGNEAFNRVLDLEVNPASELTITSTPREGTINYYFGETEGIKTSVKFTSEGTLFRNFVQTFILDPLPSYMKFDLTVLGERSFVYEADRSYDLTYMVNSTQNEKIITLELDDLPKKLEVNWGLNINLEGKTGSGFLDLNMSSNLNQAKIFLKGREEPFIKINDFPQKFYVKGSIDIPNLKGSVEVKKQSSSITDITVPVVFNKWKIVGVLEFHDGHAKASFDLPKEENNRVEIGVDTNNDVLLGLDLSVVDLNTDSEVVKVEVDRISTDDLSIHWDNNKGQIQNLEWNGKVTKFINLYVSINYESASLNISGSWDLKQGGSFLFELNKPVQATFVDMESSDFKIYGYISLYKNRKLSLDWDFDETGHIQIYTFGKSLGNQFDFILAYDPNASYNYQYGCSLEGQDFINITRTIMWDTEHGILPRIWILGDKALPGDWTVQILWKGEWYPVPYTP
ncbi:MAG: PKD domain-containing protein [Candidatus Thermoplasmatota archaeon]